MLDGLAELGILTPDEDGYDPDDVALIAAIGRFRAGGYDEAIDFTVYEAYRDALTPLVEREVELSSGSGRSTQRARRSSAPAAARCAS